MTVDRLTWIIKDHPIHWVYSGLEMIQERFLFMSILWEHLLEIPM